MLWYKAIKDFHSRKKFVLVYLSDYFKTIVGIQSKKETRIKMNYMSIIDKSTTIHIVVISITIISNFKRVLFCYKFVNIFYCYR